MGLVLRAETSNSHRYLRDYTGLDMEMTVEEQYAEALEILIGCWKHTSKGIYERFIDELQAVKRHHMRIWCALMFSRNCLSTIDYGRIDESGGNSRPPSDRLRMT